jgi:hypothetical protein
MADVVSHDVSDEQHGQAYAYNGENKVEPVCSCGGEAIGEQMFYGMDNPFQRPSGQGGENAYHKTDEQYEAFVVDLLPVASAPFQESCGTIAQEVMSV